MGAFKGAMVAFWSISLILTIFATLAPPRKVEMQVIAELKMRIHTVPLKVAKRIELRGWWYRMAHFFDIEHFLNSSFPYVVFTHVYVFTT